MEKIKLAELAIDDKALIASTAKVKKQIDELKKAQSELKKSGQESSKEYVRNAADLKVLSSAYNQNIKALSQRTQATADAANREQLLNTVLLEQVDTVAEAREQNKLLNKLRNETNVTTAQGQKELKALNDALDQNNQFIKENVDAYTQQKINIGNYKDSIKEAFQEINIFNGGLGGFIARSKEAGGVGKLVTSSLGGMVQGFVGLTKAATAFLLTPIGVVVAAMGTAFLLVKNALNRNEEAMTTLKKAFAPFTGIVKGLLGALEPLSKFLINTMVKSLELVEKGIYNALDAIASGLSFLGFDDAAASVKSFNNEVQESARVSKELAQAEAELEKSQRKARLTQLEYQKQAEKLRQIRDDGTLSIRERAQANEELGAVLKQQLDAELAIAQQALAVANLRIQSEGKTKETLDAQAEALTEIADIQERITGQESEQLTNRVALQKEAADKAKEIADNAIKDQEAQLELFIQQQGTRAKTLEQQLKIAQQVADKEIAILDAQLKNRNITQTEYDAQLLAIKNDLIQKTAELAGSNAQRELDEYIKANQSKLDNDAYFSDESLRQEQERLDAIAEKRREFAEIQYNEGLTNQTEYNDAINAINEENRLAQEQLELERQEAQKVKEAEDLENQRAIDEERFKNEFDLKLERLKQQKEAELENAESTGADKTLIEAKYAQYSADIETQKQEQKLSQAATVFNGIAELLGKESAAGKAAAIAASIINTAQGVTKALSQGGILGIAMGALVGITGAVNIAKIASTKPPKREKASTPRLASGGIIGVDGPRHSAGGVPLYAGSQYIGEVEGGEGVGVLSRAAFGGFLDFNNSYGGGSSYRGFMQGGGIITQAVGGSNNNSQLASEIAAANAQLPAPVVTVEDIHRESGKYTKVISGADV